jgi:hypothetical protein
MFSVLALRTHLTPLNLHVNLHLNLHLNLVNRTLNPLHPLNPLN